MTTLPSLKVTVPVGAEVGRLEMLAVNVIGAPMVVGVPDVANVTVGVACVTTCVSPETLPE
jgi:hypothetical protein